MLSGVLSPWRIITTDWSVIIGIRCWSSMWVTPRDGEVSSPRNSPVFVVLSFKLKWIITPLFESVDLVIRCVERTAFRLPRGKPYVP